MKKRGGQLLDPQKLTVPMSKTVWRAPWINRRRNDEQVRYNGSAVRSCSDRLGSFEDESLAFVLNASKDDHFLLPSSLCLPFPVQGIASPKFICWGGYRRCCSERRSRCTYDRWFLFCLADARTEHHLFGQPIHLYPSPTNHHNPPYTGILFSVF